MENLFEYGVLERILDIFITLKRREDIPPSAFLVLDLLGVSTKESKAEVMTFFIELASKTQNIREFEDFIRFGTLSSSAYSIHKPEFEISAKPVSHLKLSFWAS